MNSALTVTSKQKQLGQVRLFITMNNLNDALELLKKVIGDEPFNPQAFNLLGVVYEKQKDHDKACRLYRAALALDPAYQPAIINLHRLVRLPSDFTGPDLGVEKFQLD